MNPYSAYGYNPGSVLGLQAPGSRLTPEELAELQRIRGLGGQQQTFGGNLNLEGATTPATPGFRQQVKQGVQQGLDATGQAIGRGKEAAQQFLGKYGKYAPVAVGAASLVPGVTTAISELSADRPAGALGALAPGALSAVGTGLTLIKHPLAQVAGYGLMGLGALLPGAAAKGVESVKQKITGEPTTGSDSFSTQLAMRGKITEQDLSMLNRELGVRTSNIKDLTQFYNQAQVDQYKAMAPELEKAKRNDFIRYQSAMALQGNIQGQLGVLATAGALAQDAQAGSYGLTQTALTTNPYANATLQAPQIRFG